MGNNRREEKEEKGREGKRREGKRRGGKGKEDSASSTLAPNMLVVFRRPSK